MWTPTEAEKRQLIEWWRVSIAYKQTRIDRLNWSAAKFIESHTEVKKMAAYKVLHNLTS